jgi:AraC-like DNA-binding protein
MTRDDPRERLIFLRPAALPGVEIMCASDSLQPWHVFHERFALCACRTAAAGWHYRQREHLAGDRGVMLLEPGETHYNTTVGKRSNFSVVFMESSTMETAAGDLGLPHSPHLRVAQTYDRRLYEALYRFAGAVEMRASALAQESAQAELLRAMFRFAERVPQESPAGIPRGVSRAKDYLRAHVSEDVRLTELARMSGLSRFHLLRQFKRTVGFPPHAFQTHVRVEKAAALLRAGHSAAQAASAVGFADQSHLARHLKRIWRVTPGAYAQARC